MGHDRFGSGFGWFFSWEKLVPLEFRIAESPSLVEDTQPELTSEMAEPVVPTADGSEAPTLPAELPAEGMGADDADGMGESVVPSEAVV